MTLWAIIKTEYVGNQNNGFNERKSPIVFLDHKPDEAEAKIYVNGIFGPHFEPSAADIIMFLDHAAIEYGNLDVYLEKIEVNVSAERWYYYD